jgi:LPXTG-motif cell wall-anchored protein
MMKTDDQRGVSVILSYTALLFILIGFAGRMKAEFHYRTEISGTAFVVAGILAALAVVLFLFSLRKKRG